jgi:hypothetical protein
MSYLLIDQANESVGVVELLARCGILLVVMGTGVLTGGSARKAFLLMPFDPAMEWLRDLLVAAGAEAGVVVERADDIFAAGVVIDQVKARIREADAVIAVCTGRNANVFYEMGLADEQHAIIMVAESADDLPFDVQHFRAQLYGGALRDTLPARIKAALIETIDNRLPKGRRLGATAVPAPNPRLEARVFERSKSSHVFEVANRGNVALHNVYWELPDKAANWKVFTDQLPEYPVEVLEPGDNVRTLVSITMGGPISINVVLRAELADGTEYTRPRHVSIY